MASPRVKYNAPALSSRPLHLVQIWDLDGVITAPPRDAVRHEIVEKIAETLLNDNMHVAIVTGREWLKIKDWLLPVLEKALGGWKKQRAPLSIYAENGAVSIERFGTECMVWTSPPTDYDTCVPALAAELFQRCIHDIADRFGFPVYGRWNGSYSSRTWMSNEPKEAYIDMQPGKVAMVSPKLGIPSHLSEEQVLDAEQRFKDFQTAIMAAIVIENNDEKFSRLKQHIDASHLELRVTAIAIDLQHKLNTKMNAGRQLHESIQTRWSPAALRDTQIVGIGDSPGDILAVLPLANTGLYRKITHIHVGNESQTRGLIAVKDKLPELAAVEIILPQKDSITPIYGDLAIMLLNTISRELERDGQSKKSV